MSPNHVLLALLVLCLALAFPGTVRDAGGKRFALTFCGSFIRLVLGVVVPVLYFVLSMALSPEWKKTNTGPLNCLLETKIWLSPLAVWAWVSFYLFIVVRIARVRGWITLGLFTGCVGSIACEAVLALNPDDLASMQFDIRLVPYILPLIYIPVWYGVAAWRAHKLTRPRWISYSATLLGQSALWLWAIDKAYDAYRALPDNPPDCYVVTASAYGYPWLVRAEMRCDAHGRWFLETKQLARFRRFEALWRARFPGSHARFRRLYDRAGPFLARRIRHPLLASASYLALKPLEAAAMLLLHAVD